MKPLFKKKDIIVNPAHSMNELYEGVEIPTFYNKVNDILVDKTFLNVVPNDGMDLDIKRSNLISMFRNRAKFLLINSINLAKASLDNLSIIYNRENSNKDMFITIDMGYSIGKLVDNICNDMPYIFDLTFYFNEDIFNYSSLMTISLNMTGITYNELYVRCGKMKKEEIEQLYNSINKIFITLTETFIGDLMTLCQESRLYFEAGNYEYYENTNSFERSVSLEQQESLTAHPVLTHNDSKVSLEQEKELYEEFKRFLGINSRNNF